MNKCIGYTSGVFDLFHAGHLNILRRSKEQCDFLIVGVSNDDLVMQYKGRKTIIPYEERRDIIAAIKYVDMVVEQKSLDKYIAWQEYHFDKLFHGDDWKGDPLYSEWEGKLIQEGVQIIYFPYTKGISSTIIRERIDKRNQGK